MTRPPSLRGASGPSNSAFIKDSRWANNGISLRSSIQGTRCILGVFEHGLLHYRNEFDTVHHTNSTEI